MRPEHHLVGGYVRYISPHNYYYYYYHRLSFDIIRHRSRVANGGKHCLGVNLPTPNSVQKYQQVVNLPTDTILPRGGGGRLHPPKLTTQL